LWIELPDNVLSSPLSIRHGRTSIEPKSGIRIYLLGICLISNGESTSPRGGRYNAKG
jgi:hypothetical protein